MGCSESLEILRQIRDAIASQEHYKNEKDGDWTITKIGKHLFIGKSLAYSAASSTHDINFPRAVEIKSVSQIWNDATAKDFAVRACTNPVTADYVNIDTATANTDTDTFIQDINLKLPPGGQLRISYANCTVAKIVNIVIQVDEL